MLLIVAPPGVLPRTGNGTVYGVSSVSRVSIDEVDACTDAAARPTGRGNGASTALSGEGTPRRTVRPCRRAARTHPGTNGECARREVAPGSHRGSIFQRALGQPNERPWRNDKAALLGSAFRLPGPRFLALAAGWLGRKRRVV